MRKVLLTMIILLTSYATIFAQGIEIAFALPVGNCQLSDNTAKMLRSKFLPAMSESGVDSYFLRVTIYENLHNKGNCDRKFNGNITQLLIRMGGR